MDDILFLIIILQSIFELFSIGHSVSVSLYMTLRPFACLNVLCFQRLTIFKHVYQRFLSALNSALPEKDTVSIFLQSGAVLRRDIKLKIITDGEKLPSSCCAGQAARCLLFSTFA